MIPIANFEHAGKFLEADVSMQNRFVLATEIRHSIEIMHTSEYLNFLKCYFRVFSTLLTQIIKPQTIDNVEHKFRNVVIERFSIGYLAVRCFTRFVQDLLKLSMLVLACDNEENGLICLRIIFELHKNFCPALEPDVQQFLDFLLKIFHNFRAILSYVFDESSTGDVPAPPHNHGYMGQMRSPAGGLMSGQLNPSTRGRSNWSLSAL